ncbi:hypothetical protein [Nesterenkonia flava]|uniref:Uncharacterized protein n=1 Tax=Nesterenkonia flava TaxID=469799 RepID=A0ABU1FVI1_9MICC|nr:hypothetical protein [Nesterenkonia flava]MDR5712485.1 hypothetical protein [Nesterenkonia flava]
MSTQPPSDPSHHQPSHQVPPAPGGGSAPAGQGPGPGGYPGQGPAGPGGPGLPPHGPYGAPQGPQGAPQGRPGKRRTGLIAGLIAVVVLFVAFVVIAVLFLSGRLGSAYPDEPLSASDLEQVLPGEDSEDLPSGVEVLGESEARSAEHAEIEEILSYQEEQVEWAEDLVGDVDGAEECLAALEDYSDYLRDDLYDDVSSHPAERSASNRYELSTGDEAQGYTITYSEPQNWDGEWERQYVACTPVRGEEEGRDLQARVVEEGDVHGVVLIEDGETINNLRLSREFGTVAVEFTVYGADAADEDALIEEMLQLLEISEQQIRDLD